MGQLEGELNLSFLSAPNFASSKFFSIHRYLFVFPEDGREDMVHKKDSLPEVSRTEKS